MAGSDPMRSHRAIRIDIPWGPGDKVQWWDRAGIFRRDIDDEFAEVVIAERVYLVRRAELRPG